MKIKNRKYPFILLELMVAIAILAIIAGVVFWRIFDLIERRVFFTDAERLRELLLTSHMLARNTQSDFRLHFQKNEKGWDVLLNCREDLDQHSIRRKLSALDLQFQDQILTDWTVDFYSSGTVSPKGLLLLIQNKDKPSSPQIEWKFPEIFHQKEGTSLVPQNPKIG